MVDSGDGKGLHETFDQRSSLLLQPTIEPAGPLLPSQDLLNGSESCRNYIRVRNCWVSSHTPSQTPRHAQTKTETKVKKDRASSPSHAPHHPKSYPVPLLARPDLPLHADALTVYASVPAQAPLHPSSSSHSSSPPPPPSPAPPQSPHPTARPSPPQS